MFRQIFAFYKYEERESPLPQKCLTLVRLRGLLCCLSISLICFIVKLTDFFLSYLDDQIDFEREIRNPLPNRKSYIEQNQKPLSLFLLFVKSFQKTVGANAPADPALNTSLIIEVQVQLFRTSRDDVVCLNYCVRIRG